MVELSREVVEHVARLAHIGLTPDEIEHFASELTSVIEHVNKLQELETVGIEPTAHAIPTQSVMREDEPRPSWNPFGVIANAPRRVDDQFAVQAIFD